MLCAIRVQDLLELIAEFKGRMTAIVRDRAQRREATAFRGLEALVVWKRLDESGGKS